MTEPNMPGRSPAAPRGMSPWELAHLYEKPLDDAELAIDMALGRQEQLEEQENPDPRRLAAVGDALLHAQTRQASLRAAGRAGLSTIEDFPPEETFRAQMQIDGRAEKIETVLTRVGDLNAYAAGSDNPIVAVAGTMMRAGGEARGHAKAGAVYFLRPKGGNGATIARDGEDHHLDVASSRAYELDIHPSTIQRLRRRYSHEFPGHEIDHPLENLVFASSPLEVGQLFADNFNPRALRGGKDGILPPAVIYGEEAVDAFASLLGGEAGSLRLGLFGVMRDMGRQYEGPGMEKDAADTRDIQDAFRRDLGRYCRTAALSSCGDGDLGNYMLLTPEVQQFIEVSDESVVAHLQQMVRQSASVRFSGKDIMIDTLDTGIDAQGAWQMIGGLMEELGFKDVAARMLEPAAQTAGSAETEWMILNDKLHEAAGRTPPPNRRQRKRLISAIEEAQKRSRNAVPA